MEILRFFAYLRNGSFWRPVRQIPFAGTERRRVNTVWQIKMNESNFKLSFCVFLKAQKLNKDVNNFEIRVRSN